MPVLAGLLYAALVAAAFPPVGFWPATILSPLPLIWLAIRSAPVRSRWFRSPALLASLGVLPLHLYEHHWIIEVSGFGFIPMAAIMAIFSGWFVSAAIRTLRRFPRLPLTLVIPVLWTAVEVLRGEVIATGYPWLLLAHPLIEAPILASPAAIIGTYGVSFLVVTLCGAAADLAWARRRGPAAVGVAFVVAVYGLSIAMRPSDAPDGVLRIAVVQTNLPQDNKLDWTPEQRESDFERFLVLTKQAAATSPDLIVWPETMFPGYFLDPLHLTDEQGKETLVPFNEYAPRLLELQSSIGVPMMIGALGADRLRLGGEPRRVQFDALHNSVFLAQGGRISATRYDKIDLTPFGEIFPIVWRWPWLQQKLLDFAAHGMSFELSPGARPLIFRFEGPRQPGQTAVLTPICFEATKPALCRKLERQATGLPRVCVNLTNDGWFGAFDPARWQHLQIARWRAVELNTPVVRAANTGVSTAIDAHGRLLKAGVDGSAAQARVDGVLTTDIHPGQATTIYARCGDVLGWSSLAGASIALIATFIRGRPKEQP